MCYEYKIIDNGGNIDDPILYYVAIGENAS
jgi:hypothetical protein